MSVYVDGLRWWGMKIYGREVKTCHLTADTQEELEAFTRKLGISPHWMHRGSQVHFDLTARWRKFALENGAVVRRSHKQRTPD